MRRENLKCSATNCTFNKNLECSAGAIYISGIQADKSEQTTCSSYVDKISNSLISGVSLERTHPNNIRCEAYKCKYNRSENCTADNVKINAYKSSCDTFISQ